MKNTFALTFAAILLITVVATTAKADLSLTEKYGVDIVDKSSDGNDLNLYNLFNNYFADQLTTGYTSSNDLFNARGVDPNATWTTNKATLTAAFKVAAYDHALSVVLGETTKCITDGFLTNNISNPTYGLVDLTSTYDISDMTDATWDLQVRTESGGTYFVHSDSSLNPEGLIHMVAFDVTDIYNVKTFGMDISKYVDNAYMFGWEDITGMGADRDFQDFVGIITNIKHSSGDTSGSSTTPEPATLAMIALGLSVLPITRRFTKTNK